jgi:hypothetical protein
MGNFLLLWFLVEDNDNSHAAAKAAESAMLPRTSVAAYWTLTAGSLETAEPCLFTKMIKRLLLFSLMAVVAIDAATAAAAVEEEVNFNQHIRPILAFNPLHIHDLQAAILNQMGIDHTKLTYKFQGSALG